MRTQLVATPKVLALARKQYGCPTLEGVPLEDMSMGAGVHWEARVFGKKQPIHTHNTTY